jgi:hypothetical protein
MGNPSDLRIFTFLRNVMSNGYCSNILLNDGFCKILHVEKLRLSYSSRFFFEILWPLPIANDSSIYGQHAEKTRTEVKLKSAMVDEI